MTRSTFVLPTPGDFGFDATVRSHGWYNLLPFRYDANRMLRAAFEVAPGRAVAIRLDEQGRGTLRVRIEGEAGRAEVEPLVRSMLQLDQDLAPLHRALARNAARYAWVKERGAGRLLRSPTAFEDAVKVLLTTNCTWTVTTAMVQRLVALAGSPAPDGSQAFPTAARLAGEPVAFFRDRIRTGYRAEALRDLARAVASGALDPERWRLADRPTAEIREEVLGLRGFGPYAVDQILRLAGRYDHPALDSWMRVKWRELHPRSKASDAQILRRYITAFGPHAGMAVWLDLTADWHSPDDAPAWP